MRKLGIGLLAMGLVGLMGTAALAQPPGKGKGKGSEKGAGKKDMSKFKGKFGHKGGWGKGFGGFRGMAYRGRHHHGRFAGGPRGHRGRHAGRGYRGYRGRHASRGGMRGFRGRHGHRGRFGRSTPGWGRSGRFGRPGFGRPGFGRPGFGDRFGGFGKGKGFAGKGAFAMGFSRGGLLKNLKLSDEQQKKLGELRKTEASAIKKAFETARDDMRKGLKGILTAEQYKKFEEATKKFKAPTGKDKGKGKKDRKPKDDLESSTAPALPAVGPIASISKLDRVNAYLARRD